MPLTHSEIEEAFRELVSINRELTVQIRSLSFLLYAVIALSDKCSLQLMKKILDSHSASVEFGGELDEALRDAREIVSLICGSDGPVDLGKLLYLIPGGKNE